MRLGASVLSLSLSLGSVTFRCVSFLSLLSEIWICEYSKTIVKSKREFGETKYKLKVKLDRTNR